MHQLYPYWSLSPRDLGAHSGGNEKRSHLFIHWSRFLTTARPAQCTCTHTSIKSTHTTPGNYFQAKLNSIPPIPRSTSLGAHIHTEYTERLLLYRPSEAETSFTARESSPGTLIVRSPHIHSNLHTCPHHLEAHETQEGSEVGTWWVGGSRHGA